MARYDKVAMTLHWALAALALSQIALGWWMTGLADTTGAQRDWFNLHKSLGLTVGALMLARLAWRLRHRPPPLPATLPRWQRRAAAASHRLLYGALIAQPLVGYLGSSFSAYPIRYFGAPLPAWGWASPALKALFSQLHLGLAWAITALVALHISAALAHLARDDRIFGRMWPRRRRRLALRWESR